jgi:hypothetical protein
MPLPKSAISKINRSYARELHIVEPIQFPERDMNTGGYKTLRKWQARAKPQLQGERLSLVIAMPGSGKTTLQLSLPIQDIEASGFTRKVVIAAPKLLIAQNFARNGEQLSIGLTIDGKNYDIVVEHDFTNTEAASKVTELRQFMMSEVPGVYKSAFERDNMISGCICVTTHAALSAVTSSASEEDIQTMMKDTTFIIDEAHHVKGVFDVFEDNYDPAALEHGTDLTNRLGSFVHKIVNRGPDSVKLIMASAYPFRADKQPILYPEIRKRFGNGIFVLPFLEYFKNISIKKIDLNYQIYDVSPVDDILAKIKDEPGECHLIAVPGRNRLWRKKPGELDRLYAGLRKLYPDIEILDLVPEEGREARMARLLRETKNNPNAITLRAIIYVAVVNEGVDWAPCSRLHNASFGSSLPNELQKVGRTLRDFLGKTHAVCTAYLPDFVGEDPEDGKTQINYLNTALLVGMQYDDMCHPIFLPEVVVSSLQKAGRSNDPDSAGDYLDPEDGEGEPTHNDPTPIPLPALTLEEAFGDRVHEVNEAIIKLVEPLKFKLEKNIVPVLRQIMVDFYTGPESGHADALKALEVKVLRNIANGKVPDLRYVDRNLLEELGFDRIVYMHGMAQGSMYSCELTEEELTELRKLINSRLANTESLKADLHAVKFNPKGSSKKERNEKLHAIKRKLEVRAAKESAASGDSDMLTKFYPHQIEGKNNIPPTPQT